jgi:REP element-mobilizing transposase RayT
MESKDKHILKSYNKSLLLYYFACPAKYRRKVFRDSDEKALRNGETITYNI